MDEQELRKWIDRWAARQRIEPQTAEKILQKILRILRQDKEK